MTDQADHHSPLTGDANAGRVALVTGGGTGIGRAIALAFAATGASVAVCGRRAELLEETRTLIEAGGGACMTFPCDIREPDETDAMLSAVLERFGRIDVLVNNAGGQFENTPENVSLKGWRAVHRLTVDAAWNLTHAVATRSMIANRRGLIVFIGFSPRRGIPGFAHASAARATLENLAQGLSLEWSRYGIRSVCIAAGSIDTEGARAAYGDEEMDRSAGHVPLGRLGRPEEIGTLVAYLATDAASYITGTSVVIDGGLDAWGLGEPPPAPSRT